MSAARPRWSAARFEARVTAAVARRITTREDKQMAALGPLHPIPQQAVRQLETSRGGQEGKEAAVAVAGGGICSEISAARGIGSPDKLAVRL